MHQILQPEGWPRPAGYANGVTASGRLVFVEFRGEDEKVPIKRVHKMTEAQVKKEMAASDLWAYARDHWSRGAYLDVLAGHGFALTTSSYAASAGSHGEMCCRACGAPLRVAPDAVVIDSTRVRLISEDTVTGQYVFQVINGPAPELDTMSIIVGAQGEGFGDYWAFSNSPAGGFDPPCIGEWDLEGTCLRRVDGAKRYPEDLAGEVHEDDPGIEFLVDATARPYGRISRLADIAMSLGLLAISAPMRLAPPACSSCRPTHRRTAS